MITNKTSSFVPVLCGGLGGCEGLRTTDFGRGTGDTGRGTVGRALRARRGGFGETALPGCRLAAFAVALALTLAFCAPGVLAQVQRTVIPDIPGYKTLLCDFHIHTSFSDGVVWPTVRVDEAEREGLSSIALTEHLESRRFIQSKSVTRNGAHDAATQAAKDKNIILIRGGEITRALPPGHVNAIFLTDCDPLYQKEWTDSVAEAKKQNAFITWNHPDWDPQLPHTTSWFPEHEELLKKGCLHGIEVANGTLYSPKAFQWALDKKLTMLGCSDAHPPLSSDIEYAKGEHRTMTLVFARERTAAGIREALDNRRTAVYFREFLFGEEQWLRPVLEQSLVVHKMEYPEVTSKYRPRIAITFKNNSSMTFRLRKIVPGENPVYYRERIVKPYGFLVLNVATPEDTGADEVSFEVANFLTTPEKPLVWTIKLPREVPGEKPKSKTPDAD